MRWDEKQPFNTVTYSFEGFWSDIEAINLHFCARMPRCCHPLAKDMLNQNIWLIGGVARLFENLNDLATIKTQLQPLQSQAFACSLRAYQNGEITKIKIDRLEVGEVLDRQRNQAGRRMFDCSLIHHLRISLTGVTVRS